MKNFVKGLITNRFGIVLAALNVCYFLSKNFVQLVFEHTHEENCSVFNHHFLLWMQGSSANLLFAKLNSVAILFSLLPGKFMQMIFPDLCIFTQVRFQIVFFIFFVTLQWLFIGYLAKIIARKIRQIKN